MINFIRVVIAGALAFVMGSAQAALIDRGGGLIYDTDRNITWLQDANYGAGSIYDNGSSTSDGRMTWGNAKKWADDLLFAGYQDWRLPTAENNCSYEWDCNYGEIGHLFFDEIGAKRGSSVFAVTDTLQLENFVNVQDYVYWTSLTYNAYPAYDPGAIGFLFSKGTQSDFWQRNDFFVWAVRDGDSSAPIPEPETYSIVLVGLGILGLARRRKLKQALA